MVDFKTGTHYVELKVYSCDEIQNRTDANTEGWARLTDYIYVNTTRNEFKHSPPSFNITYH